MWWNGAFLTFEATRRFAFELCLASGYKVLILSCPGVPPNWVKEGGIAHFKDTHPLMLPLLLIASCVTVINVAGRSPGNSASLCGAI